MPNIIKLIEKLCPNGVEYKRIEEVCNNIFSGGTPKTSNEDYYGGNIPWLRSGEINFNEITDAEIKITEKGLNESSAKWIKPKSVLIALTGATVARSAVNEIAITANQSVCAMEVSDKINYKFLYYTIANKYNEIKGMAQGALTSINLSIIKSIKIAVPPLEVQDEIVHILDDFTLLSAELSAELKAREKQYAYYKDNLFDFEDKVKVPLSEICSMERGGNFQKKHFTEGGIPAIHYGKIYTYYGLYTDKTLNFIDEEIAKKQKFANNNDIVMAVTSENVEDVCKCVVWEGKESVAVSGHSVIIRHNQNARFLAYYFTTSHFQKQKEKYCIGTKVIEMKPDNLAKILVPIPSIEEQNRIVSILDKFYSITNDISKGLPAEIEARKKQYEYYRDKLLTFKELKVNEG